MKKFKEKPKKEQVKIILAMLLSVITVVLVSWDITRTYKNIKQEQMTATIESVYAKEPSAKNLVLLWIQLSSNNSRDIYHYLDDAFAADDAELEQYLTQILDADKDPRGCNFKAMYLSSVLARCTYDEDFSRFQMIFEEYIPKLPVLYRMAGIASQPKFYNREFVYKNHEAILDMLNRIIENETQAEFKIYGYKMIASFYLTEKGFNEEKYQFWNEKCKQCFEENTISQAQQKYLDEAERAFVEYWEDII